MEDSHLKTVTYNCQRTNESKRLGVLLVIGSRLKGTTHYVTTVINTINKDLFYNEDPS